jgi:hypothetical protein
MITGKDIPNDNGFLTSLEQLKDLFGEGCANRFKGTTKGELASWQDDSGTLLRRLLGFDTFKPCENRLYEISREDAGGHLRYKYVLQTEEKVYMPFFTLIPADKKPEDKRPVVICPQGHFRRAKESVAAVRFERDVDEDIAEFDLNYGEDFVKRGYIAFCPDARGFGERAEKARQADGEWKCTCTHLNRMGIPLGRCAIGMSVWDLTKLIDYIVTRPDCDAGRIGCSGLSGGGYQSLYLAAVDTRVKCVGVSGYFYGFMESLLEMNENCDCNYIPGLWRHFDAGDIGALVAPRPLIIETGSRDPLNGKSGMDNVYPQLAITEKAYGLYGFAGKLAHAVFDGVHKWDGKDIYPFFEENL